MSGFRIPQRLRDDPEVEAKVRQVVEALRANPLHAYNNPELLPAEKVHQRQLEFNRVKAPVLGVKALIAGNRSGKTYAVKTDDVIQLVPRDDVPPHLLECKKFEPPVDIWMGAPKYAKHEDTTIPLLRKLIPRNQLREGNFDRSYNAHSRSLRLNCGSTVGFKTYDQDIDAWSAAAVHRISWDEEPNNANGRKLREEARARLISTGGDELLGMTPVLGISTWAYDEIWEKRHLPDITVIGMGIEDNPWNTAEAIEKYLAPLGEEERRARARGEFVHFGGLFFDEFRPRLHVVEPPPIERLREMEIVCSIDPGLVHTGVTWSAWDADNAGLFFDEFFPGKTIVPEIAAEIKRRQAQWALRAEPTYIIDPSYRSLESPIYAEEVQAAYVREGLYCQPGQNDRPSGILAIKRRLQATDPAGRPAPTLLFSRAVPETIKQVERYRRNPDAADEWQAVPQDDRTRWDLVDSARYAVLSRVHEDPDKPLARRPSYSPNFQPPFEVERDLMQADAPPMGDYS